MGKQESLTARDFGENFRKLAVFKKRFAHCRVPCNWPEDRPLASWLERQRNRWDQLTTDELSRLFGLGVRFGYRPDQWIARMVDLKAFRAEHGHINISQHDPMYGSLGRWCSKKRGQREKLSPGQIRLMDELGFVWDPLQARYLERLEELRVFRRQHGHCDVPSGHPELGHLASWLFHIRAAEISLPDWVRRELDKLGFDYRPLWERQWEERFAEAKRFQEKHGHLRVPRGTELATWISEQRHKRSPLSEERRKRLEEIGFDWDPQQTAWNRQFANLERFKREHSHCNVPGQYPENPRLGAWVNYTRQNADRLSPERRQRLEAIGFVWSVNGPNPHHSWGWWYEKLVEFQRRHGHCRVSEHSGPDIALGSWVSRMRAQRAQLSKSRRQLLDQIGFCWTPFDTEWAQKFRELAEFKVTYGHCNVPLAHPENPSLGVWVANQRAKHNRRALRPEREGLLTALGLVWDMAEEQWMQRLEELRVFKRRFGHCNVPAQWKENPELARWVAKMRARKDRQSAERIKRLGELGFEWRPVRPKNHDRVGVYKEFRRLPFTIWKAGKSKRVVAMDTGVNRSRNRRWQDRYEEAVHYRARHGHLRLPQDHPLFDWLRYQRKRREEGVMSEQQKALLDQIHFDWGKVEGPFDGARPVDMLSEGPEWDFHFGELSNFRERHGHLRVPRPYPACPKLPGWLAVQKTKIDRLTLSQIRRLWNLGVRFPGAEPRWLFRFFKLVEARERLGDANNVAIWENDEPLRNWVGIQRSWHNKGKLARHRVRLLEEIGFLWDVREAAWEKHYSDLLAYKARFGHALVPYNWAENPELGRWLAKQRSRAERLTPERKRRLEELGCFTGRECLEWEERFEQWKTYVREHGTTEISSDKRFSSLGSWSSAQRMKRRRGELTPDQIRRLEEAGFLWEPRNEHWERHYEELVAYRQQHGHCHVPNAHENVRLYAWYSLNKRLGNRGDLSPERKARLDALNFPWNYKDEVWEFMLGKLAQFRLLYGHCRVPDDWSEPGLFKWTTRQRRAKLDGKLTPVRIARLEALGFEWSYQPRRSEPIAELAEAITCVTDFHTRHGRCPGLADIATNPVPVAACGTINRSRDFLQAEQVIRLASLGFDFGDKRDRDWIGYFAELAKYRPPGGSLPSDDPEPLARWCVTQRSRKDRGLLAPYRAKWLDQLGFRWQLRNKFWDIRYEELKRYKARHGHCAVPVHALPHKHLGRWVFTQRRRLREGTIDPERKAKLDAIGFVWRIW